MPVVNSTAVSFDLYENGQLSTKKISATIVEAVNGTAELDVFTEGNRFSDDIRAFVCGHIQTCIVVKRYSLCLSHQAKLHLIHSRLALHVVKVKSFIDKQRITTRATEELLFVRFLTAAFDAVLLTIHIDF